MLNKIFRKITFWLSFFRKTEKTSLPAIQSFLRYCPLGRKSSRMIDRNVWRWKRFIHRRISSRKFQFYRKNAIFPSFVESLANQDTSRGDIRRGNVWRRRFPVDSIYFKYMFPMTTCSKTIPLEKNRMKLCLSKIQISIIEKTAKNFFFSSPKYAKFDRVTGLRIVFRFVNFLAKLAPNVYRFIFFSSPSSQFFILRGWKRGFHGWWWKKKKNFFPFFFLQIEQKIIENTIYRDAARVVVVVVFFFFLQFFFSSIFFALLQAHNE